MTLLNVLATREALRRYIDLPGTADDPLLDDILRTVTLQFQRTCHRQFFVWEGSRVFRALDSHRVLTPDLLAVTEIGTDVGGALTYTRVWDAGDYLLEPANGPTYYPPKPYQKIETSPLGSNSFPTGPRGVRVTGSWGYFDVRQAATSLLTAGVNATTPTIPVTDGDEFEVGHLLRVDEEQMAVQAITANNLTVLRHINGTEPASHLDDAEIEIYTFPELDHLALLQGEYVYRTRDTVGGTLGSPEVGFVRVLPLQPVVHAGLATFKRKTVA